MTYRALVVDKEGGEFRAAVRDLDESSLPDGDVTIRVAWSSVNYKDGLACSPGNRVVTRFPMTPGVDLAAEIGDVTTLTVGLDDHPLGPLAAKLGWIARTALGDALLVLGAAALAAGRRDDVATLVPLYVAMPRGVIDAGKEMAWSPDRP